MHPSLLPKHGRSMAPRSGQVVLSCPSSLQGHSDFPTPVTQLLPVSSDLSCAYRRWSSAETLGSQVFPPLSFTTCRQPYPGFPAGAFALFFPASSGLLRARKGSACIPTLSDLSLIRTLPAMPVRLLLRGCTVRFMLRPVALASSPDWVLEAVSGQVQPVCYHTNPPPAYIPKRAIGMLTSFQVNR
jgi:hypothetical protein